MRLQMIHSGTNRDSLVTPADRRTFDLMLQLRLQLVRCEPTSHFNVQGTHCNGNGILHDEFGTFHLDPWQTAEWTAFRTCRPYHQRLAIRTGRSSSTLTAGPAAGSRHAHHRYIHHRGDDLPLVCVALTPRHRSDRTRQQTRTHAGWAYDLITITDAQGSCTSSARQGCTCRRQRQQSAALTAATARSPSLDCATLAALPADSCVNIICDRPTARRR